VLGGLPVHPAANGFEPERSIVTNARPHEGQAVVVKMDLRDFFPSTSADRVHEYFRAIGYDQGSTALLVRLCTHANGLPQGAPTSPKLSNLVNARLDARLDGLARHVGANYTRYADDMTFSFEEDDRQAVQNLIRSVKFIVADEGYELHQHRKLQIRRRHGRQMVTGLVVNDGVSLPRSTRRWLRAVEHRQAKTGQSTLTPAQLQGWRALANMVQAQEEA